MNGIWLRSQKKDKLVLAVAVEITPGPTGYVLTANGNIEIGEFETRDRCIEVLDNIHMICMDGKHGVYMLPEQ